MHLVFFRKYNIFHRNAPIYSQVRIIPCNGSFTLRCIEVITLVLEYRFFREHHETVRKASRYEELSVVLFRQFDCNVSSESRRAAPYVYSHIQHASLHDTPVVQIPENKEELRSVFGRRSVAMLAVTEINLAERFLGLLSEPEKYEAQIAAVREKARIMRERKQRKPGTRGPKGKK